MEKEYQFYSEGAKKKSPQNIRKDGKKKIQSQAVLPQKEQEEGGEPITTSILEFNIGLEH